MTSCRPTISERSESQRRSLEILDKYIEDLSNADDPNFWFDADRLAYDPQWARVRELARDVLAAFSWPDEPPARDGATYVGKDETVIKIRAAVQLLHELGSFIC